VIGIVIATIREAAPLLARAGIMADESPATLRSTSREPAVPLCYDLRPAHAMALCVSGMGPDRARAGVDLLLKKYAVTSVVNVGVAGALSEKRSVAGIYRVSRACLWPSAETVYACANDRWKKLPPVVLATVDEPVFDPVRRKEIARHADIVDMEGAAIAQRCQARGVPLYAIKGVTDRAGENDREQLLRNLDKVSAVLAESVWKELKGL